MLKKQTLFDCALLFLLAFGVQYLFLEGLPFFWQEDIKLIEKAESISWTALIQDIFNPSPDLFNPFSYRPMMDFCYKLALSFSGYDPSFYHLMKIIFTNLSTIIVYIAILCITKHRLYAAGGAISYVLLPPVSIATGIVSDPGNLAVLLVSITLVGFVLIERYQSNYFLFYSLQGVLFILTLIAIKTRVNGCLIPFIILSYLFVLRPKRYLKFLPLMAGMFSLLIPLWRYKGKIEHYFHFKKFTQDLENVFYIVSPFFLIFCLTILLLYFLWKILINSNLNGHFKKIKQSLEGYFSNMTEKQESLFKITLLWLTFEIPFLILFPSEEIRYLVHITFPLTILTYSTLPLFLVRKNRQSNFFRFIFLSIFLFHIYINFQWNWQFRGSLGSYFLANNKLMTFRDKKCKQCLIIHNNIGKPFFSLRTNNRYVYISESEERPKAYVDIKNIKLQFKERPPFKHIYVIHDGIIIPKTSNTLFFVGEKNTLYDHLQSYLKLKIKWVSHHLHPFSEFQEVTWPHETLMTRIRLGSAVEKAPHLRE